MSRWQPVLVPFDEPASEPSPSRDDRRLRAVSVAAAGLTVLLISIGALVRATGSGLGCPGWPKCFGRWIPPLKYHAVIEYSHRFTAFLDVVVIALVVVVAWRRYRRIPRVFRPAIAALGLVIFQAALGGIVVKGELKALLVTAHLATAMVLVGTLIYLVVAAFTTNAIRSVRPDRLARLAVAAAASIFALLVVGAYVRGEGAGLAFGDWPLMNGRLVPRISALAPALQFAHRLLAVVVGVMVAVLVVAAWRRRRTRPAVVSLTIVVGSLFVAQVLVGAANVWSRLAPAAVVAHVTLAALIWSCSVATAAVARLSNPVRPVVVRTPAAVGAIG
jgi:heme A synthase